MEARLPRALTEKEIEHLILSAHVTTESAGSLLAAIEECQNLLYVLKHTVHGDRAHDSYWYNHGDIKYIARETRRARRAGVRGSGLPLKITISSAQTRSSCSATAPARVTASLLSLLKVHQTPISCAWSIWRSM